MIHLKPALADGVGFEANKYGALPREEKRSYARISSRIATVIRVAFDYRVNYS